MKNLLGRKRKDFTTLSLMKNFVSPKKTDSKSNVMKIVRNSKQNVTSLMQRIKISVKLNGSVLMRSEPRQKKELKNVPKDNQKWFPEKIRSSRIGTKDFLTDRSEPRTTILMSDVRKIQRDKIRMNVGREILTVIRTKKILMRNVKEAVIRHHRLTKKNQVLMKEGKELLTVGVMQRVTKNLTPRKDLGQKAEPEKSNLNGSEKI